MRSPRRGHSTAARWYLEGGLVRNAEWASGPVPNACFGVVAASALRRSGRAHRVLEAPSSSWSRREAASTGVWLETCPVDC